MNENKERVENETMVSFILPALNEAETIGKTIDTIPTKKLQQMGYDTEVIVVDGGSRDETQKIARRKNARVIVEERQGYGYAYMVGFHYAKGDFIVTGDADGTYPLRYSRPKPSVLN